MTSHSDGRNLGVKSKIDVILLKSSYPPLGIDKKNWVQSNDAQERYQHQNIHDLRLMGSYTRVWPYESRSVVQTN